MASKIPDEARLAMEDRAWTLRTQFWTQDRIAKELGVSQPTVCRMLDRVERRMLAKFVKRVERFKARQTAQLEHIAKEAMEAWERSKKDAETTKITSEAGGDDSDKTEWTVRGQTGDAGYLGQARGALAEIRDIWGLNAPKDEDDGGSDGPSVIIIHANGSGSQAPG